MHVGENPNHNRVPRPLFPEIGVVAFVPEKSGGPWACRGIRYLPVSPDIFMSCGWSLPGAGENSCSAVGSRRIALILWRCSRRALLYISRRDGCRSLADPPGWPCGLRRNEVAERQHCFVNAGARLSFFISGARISILSWTVTHMISAATISWMNNRSSFRAASHKSRNTIDEASRPSIHPLAGLAGA